MTEKIEIEVRIIWHLLFWMQPIEEDVETVLKNISLWEAEAAIASEKTCKS